LHFAPAPNPPTGQFDPTLNAASGDPELFSVTVTFCVVEVKFVTTTPYPLVHVDPFVPFDPLHTGDPSYVPG
jgi:hypothetical protein